MLLSSETFRDYDTVLFNDFDYDNFKPGIYGLKLADLRTAPGLGAASIVALADIFKIEDSIEVLKFSLDKEAQVKYALSPTFKVDKDANGDNQLYFILGDWKLDLASVYEVMESVSCSIEDSIFEVQQTDKSVRHFSGFTFNLNPAKPSEKDPTKLVRAKDNSKMLSFILAYSRDHENAQQKLVEIFNSSNGELSDLYKAIVNSPYVGKVGEAFQYAQLKELPLGAYEISQIEWEDKEITKKDSGEKARIQIWKFRAVSLTDKSVYFVTASKGSFFGKAITNMGDGASPLLAIAGKGMNGKALMTLEAVEKVANGYSPKGRVFTNLDAGQKYINFRLPQLLAADSATIDVKQLAPAF